jgi:Family of unknown function (DUF6090)
MTQNQPNGQTGKTGKYLKYAISEIILVVIGILIALTINNWNQENHNKKEEHKLLNALKVEFENNLHLLDSIKVYHTANEAATDWIINSKHGEFSIVTFDSLFLKTLYNYNFDPSKGILNSLINSGKIELISNPILKYKLAEIQDLVADYVDDENNVKTYSIDIILPFIANELPYNPLRFYQNRTANEEDLHHKYAQEISKNRVFIEHLVNIKLLRIGVFAESEIVKIAYSDIIGLIGQEIDKMS